LIAVKDALFFYLAPQEEDNIFPIIGFLHTLLRFAGIHGLLGLLMLHEVIGTLYFTSDIRVAVGVQPRWYLD
jgi:hypothetical protein